MYGNADIEISINPNNLISMLPDIEISKVLHILKSTILDKSKKGYVFRLILTFLDLLI